MLSAASPRGTLLLVRALVRSHQHWPTRLEAEARSEAEARLEAAGAGAGAAGPRARALRARCMCADAVAAEVFSRIRGWLVRGRLDGPGPKNVKDARHVGLVGGADRAWAMRMREAVSVCVCVCVCVCLSVCLCVCVSLSLCVYIYMCIYHIHVISLYIMDVSMVYDIIFIHIRGDAQARGRGVSVGAAGVLPRALPPRPARKCGKYGRKCGKYGRGWAGRADGRVNPAG